MRKIALTAIISVAVLSGCATTSPMTDEVYYGLGYFMGKATKCFEAGHISPQLFADSKGAIRYTLTTWDYDSVKLNGLAEDSYRQAESTPQYCRKVESQSYELIGAVSQRQANSRANQAASSNAAQQVNVNKPIYCNRIGTTTTCF